MTEDDIRLAAEALGVIPRSKTRPKSLEVPLGGLSQAQRQTQQTLSEGIKLAAERREAEESEAWGQEVAEKTTPLQKVVGGLEAAAALPSAAVTGILGHLGEGFKLLPPGGANQFVAENFRMPRGEAGQHYFDVMAGGVEKAADWFGETPMGEFLGAAFEKVPGIFPVSGATTKAVDEGLAGAGKGMRLASEQAKQAGKRTMDAGKDLAQAARAEFATPPLGGINLGRESYVPGVEAGQELIVHHNITPAKLQKVQKVGGMPVPSIAISNVENPMMDFGDITLIGNPSMATPSAKNPVYGFDAYTARSPGISYIIDDKSKKNLADLFADVKGDIKTTSLYDLVDEWDKREYNHLMQAKFLKEKGKLPSPSDFENKWDYSRAIEKTVYEDWPEFKQWIIDFDNQLPDAGVNIKEKIFKGLTQEGRKRYVDANLENLVKAMKGGAGSEGFNYGVGNLRAIASPKFRKLDDVKSARDKIIPFEEFAKVKNQINSAYDNLWGRIAGLEDNKGYGYSSKDILYEIGQSKNVNIIDKFKVGADDKLKADIGLFIKKLKQLPTEYFEIKPQRAVNVSEFEGAIVPADVPKQSVDYLRSQGIDRIHFYSTPEERTQLFKKFQDKMFSAAPVGVGAAAMQEEEEQQYAEGGAVNPFEVPTPENLALDPILAEEREMRRLKRAQEMAQRPLAEKAKGALEAAQTTASTVGRGVLRPFAELAGQAFGEKGMGERLVQSAPQPQTEVGKHYTGEVQDVMQEVGKFLEPAKIPQGPYMPELIPSLPYANRPQMLTQKLEEEFATPPIGAVQLQTQQAPRNPLGMYSQAEQVALNLPQQKGTGNQFLAQISKTPGVKPAELEWTGLADFLKSKGDQPVTKQEIQQHLDANRVQVEAVELGDTLKARELDRWLDNWADKNPDTKTSDAIMRGLSFDEIAQVAKSENQPVVARLIGNQNNPAKYSEHQLPGGSNYREVLLTLPSKVDTSGYKVTGSGNQWYLRGPDNQIIEAFPSEAEAKSKIPNRAAASQPELFKSTHFNQPNILAHMRLNDRLDADGNRVLFVEEMQSDWGQKGREKGFESRENLATKNAKLADLKARFDKSIERFEKAQTRYNNRTPSDNDLDLIFEMRNANNEADFLRQEIDKIGTVGLPPAPFVQNTEDWVNLSLKRLITDAVNNGYKKVAFINGEQSADRYDLRKYINAVTFTKPNQDGRMVVQAFDKRDNKVMSGKHTVQEVEDRYGKELTQKMLSSTGTKDPRTGMQSLSGVDLKVGGEGMKKFYDQIVPATANKLLKKLGGGKLEPMQIGDNQQLGFTITPEMVELVKKQGLPMFAAGGAVKMSDGGAAIEEDDPGRLQRLINLYQAGLLSLDDLTEEMRGMHPYDVAKIFGGTDSNPLMRVKPGDIERMPFTPEQQEEATIPEGLDLDDLAKMDEGETEEEFKFRGTPNIRRLDREPKPEELNQPYEVNLAPGGAVTMAKGGKVAKGMSGISAAREAMKAQRREERVQKNLETYMGSAEKPQTYYHATQAPKDFRKFDLEKRPTPKSAAAVFLTPSTDWANEFDMADLKTLESATSAAPRIMPIITRAKNTFDYENPEHVEAVMKTAKFPKRSNPFGPTPAPLPLDHIQEQISLGNWNFIEDQNVQKAIKDLGFDSFNVKEKGVKNLGVFNPADVKALFNRGSYDPTTEDISKAAGGPVLKGIAKARAEAKMAAGGKAVKGADSALSGIAAARAAQKAQRASKLEEALEAKQPPMTTPQGTGLPLMPRDQGMYIPGVKQEDLPRMPKVDKARAAGKRPEYTERMEDLLQSRAAKKKVDTLIEKGDALGMREWYGIEPLRQVAMDIGMSPEKFNEFIAQMASASQRNPVDQQNRMGSYLWHLSQTGGLPSNAFLYTNKMRRGKQGLPEGSPIELPSGYGSLAQGDIFNRGLQIARGDIEGALPPDKKLGTFYRNYLGNLRPVTVDVNAVRGPIIERGDPRWLASKLVEKDEEGNVTGTYFPRKDVQSGLMSIKQAKERPGFWEAAPSGSEYAGFEDLWQSAAKRFGIQPAEAQALGWYGSADVTALKTKPELYIDNLERMIRRTAEQTGKNPRQVMEDMLRGTEYLRKKGGLVRS